MPYGYDKFSPRVLLHARRAKSTIDTNGTVKSTEILYNPTAGPRARLALQRVAPLLGDIHLFRATRLSPPRRGQSKGVWIGDGNEAICLNTLVKVQRELV